MILTSFSWQSEAFVNAPSLVAFHYNWNYSQSQNPRANFSMTETTCQFVWGGMAALTLIQSHSFHFCGPTLIWMNSFRCWRFTVMALSILDRRKCWLIQLVHLAQCQLAQCPKHKPIYRNNYLSGRFRYKNRVLFIICRQLDMVRKNRKSLSKASVCFTLRHNKK